MNTSKGLLFDRGIPLCQTFLRVEETRVSIESMEDGTLQVHEGFAKA
jgi:hypothetical protein